MLIIMAPGPTEEQCRRVEDAVRAMGYRPVRVPGADRTAICVINAGTALLSAYFTRYRTDGTVLLRGASSYLFAKVDGDWRILANMANPARKLIACD